MGLTYKHTDGRTQGTDAGSALHETLAGDPDWIELDSDGEPLAGTPVHELAQLREQLAAATAEAEAFRQQARANAEGKQPEQVSGGITVTVDKPLAEYTLDELIEIATALNIADAGQFTEVEEVVRAIQGVRPDLQPAPPIPAEDLLDAVEGENGATVPLDEHERKRLNEIAARVGVDRPDKLANKGEVIDAIVEVRPDLQPAAE